MRRGVGVGAAQQRQALAARSMAMGEAVAADRARHVQEQVETFKTHLERFARQHRDEINKDPEFRAAFARMTASIGVDPLASSKGFWGEALGLGDFYYELSIQVVDACLATRAINGGIIALSDLLARLRRMRGGRDAISEDDVRQALKKLSSLGGGYRLVSLASGAKYVVSLPEELSKDSSDVLQAASAAGRPYVTVEELCGQGARNSSSSSSVGTTAAAAPLRPLADWDRARAQRACDALIRDGMAWLDADAPDGMRRYYLPALWPQQL